MKAAGDFSRPKLGVLATALSLAAGGQVQAADENLPDLGGGAAPWVADVYYENHTVRRHDAGLAKFRNTLQVEADKPMGDGWAFRGILRGSWDGVYRMNRGEYGNRAGGPVQLENTAAPLLPPVPTSAGTPLNRPQVPHGGGINNPIGTAIGLPPTNALGFDLGANPNDGMRVLGDRWHKTEGGVAFGVPVRPCDSDSRGCRDFGGYGDLKRGELEAPEFNDRLDFLREIYAKKTFPFGDGSELFVKVGRQQVVWGRTDLFRVLDVINPIDYSRNNIYDELQDIRIPMWIAQAEYRMGASDAMQDRNVQVVWNFDKFRPNNLGQCGSPNVMLDAGCFFRGMANLWDNGGTVANFAAVPPGTAGAWAATDFGPHQIGIRNVHLPEWSLSNTQLGVKYEGITQDGLAFSLNALTYRSQLPSLHAFSAGAVNPFTGGTGNTTPPADGVPVSRLIAFDVHYPRVNLIGGSLDFQIPDANAAIRMETALTHGEEFANTARRELYSKNRVLRSVIGVDRPTFIPFISKTRATLISAQLFWQHIFDHERHDGPLGTVGMVDWEDNFIGTLLIKGFLAGDRVSPQVVMARDFRAKALTIAPQIEWSVTDDFKVTLGANFKYTNGNSHYKFDDCRSCNPYPPFTTYTAAGQSFVPGSAGLAGFEPLGRFRAGPIGAAVAEDDIYVMVRYKF
ncbi:Protein of unknown function [Aromatoleum tolulyticum]|uniref:DUF1302 domain-containing protein n=1 Tax=Aromatoleum tolulyticum TaxID=34027 RepID=A0A1N7CT56_9RHOO|nr:DUF1302 family protein [Aromatoleum tolulyticum]SIR66635.1 Protein of unknown function [Aromatoleum tolulyticum]